MGLCYFIVFENLLVLFNTKLHSKSHCYLYKLLLFIWQLKLVNPSPSRLEHLVTQMKWRLQEGEGEAIYEIGVGDNGMYVGLTGEELESSLKTLNVMASKLGAHTALLRRSDLENNGIVPARQVAEVLVRRVPDDQQVCNDLWHTDWFMVHNGNVSEILLRGEEESSQTTISTLPVMLNYFDICIL